MLPAVNQVARCILPEPGVGLPLQLILGNQLTRSQVHSCDPQEKCAHTTIKLSGRGEDCNWNVPCSPGTLMLKVLGGSPFLHAYDSGPGLALYLQGLFEIGRIDCRESAE